MSKLREAACPCGRGQRYEACCGRFHQGAEPEQPRDLMAARYSAFVLGDAAFLHRTLHQVTPRERHGQALGLRMLTVNVATVAMPVGFGLLASAFVVAAPMWLMAGLLVAAQWPAQSLRRKRA